MNMLLILLLFIANARKSVYEMTKAEFKQLLCEQTTQEIMKEANVPVLDHRKDSKFKDVVIPISFDARVTFGKCIHPIRDQMDCGSCWAFATSESISDRFCIASNGHVDIILSPQYLVSCDTYDNKCMGGKAPKAYQYMTEHGGVTDSCSPYQGVNGTCNATCDTPGVPFKLYKCKAGTEYQVNDTDSIKLELMTYGPMYTRFEVYDDFMEYRSGIYYETSKNNLGGGHAVKLIGWGQENGIDYWLLQNSWGSDWGENGYFRMKFGAGTICAFAYRCIPDLSS